MNLSEYRALQLELMQVFEGWWALKHREDPETFPMEMTPEEWDEQLDFVVLDEMRADLEAARTST